MDARFPSQSDISKLHSSITYTSREMAEIHEHYAFEQAYLQRVRQGDAEGLARLFQRPPDICIGTLADTPLRQTKNIFIVAATTATRAAIEGGLPPVEAYKLSDIYIRYMEDMTNADGIGKLQYDMVLDFTKRVSLRKLPVSAGSLVLRCTRYIASHVNEALTVKTVAAYMGLSRPYLSKIFAKELGFSMSDFIMRCKLEEAKSLLRLSNKSIGEISNYLCFSSQSYFQNVFKKKVGLTPNEYRNHRGKSEINSH